MGVYPRQCLVLRDTVAILDVGLSGDRLHTSSTNFRSWTTTTLPYLWMSLTTYQSKFVVVGGQHPSTKEVTDQLLTSATGEDWQPSLPQMPSKRSHTSSVGAKSPEVLVVAGGIGSGGKKLDLVEVLIGDQWNAVDPLPLSFIDMQAILYDDSFYFLMNETTKQIIYTCKFASLVASCGQSSNDDRTTTSSVWRKVVPPNATRAIVFYSSRLITIDKWSTIRGYSSMRQSWVKTTADWKMKGEKYYISAAVTPTGELIVAYRMGVYRVTTSGEYVY